MGGADHLKKRLRLIDAINGPGGVENFVTAVFRVNLCEHHQLGIRRVTAQMLELANQITHLVDTQGVTLTAVGFLQCRQAATQDIDKLQRGRFGSFKNPCECSTIRCNRLGHRVVGNSDQTLAGYLILCHRLKVPCDPAFHSG